MKYAAKKGLMLLLTMLIVSFLVFVAFQILPMTTRAGLPPAKACSTRSACSMLSRPKEISMLSANLRTRASLSAPTTSLAMKMSVRPLAAMASASPTLATVMPLAPSSACRLAMEAILWVLVWGRRATPCASA